jgi:anaerobic selenocysteine-containing dehydrogenase
VIRRLARELAAADAGCVYGRIGTTTTEFGTTASWLVDVLNVLPGQLDRPGGAMFPKAAAYAANTRGRPARARASRCTATRAACAARPRCSASSRARASPRRSRRRRRPGRALITIAGNPAVSTPNAGALARALATLDFMVSVDIYLNETTRHADVILPGLSPLEQSHFDIAFPQLSCRNWVRYSHPCSRRRRARSRSGRCCCGCSACCWDRVRRPTSTRSTTS